MNIPPGLSLYPGVFFLVITLTRRRGGASINSPLAREHFERRRVTPKRREPSFLIRAAPLRRGALCLRRTKTAA